MNAEVEGGGASVDLRLRLEEEVQAYHTGERSQIWRSERVVDRIRIANDDEPVIVTIEKDW